MSEEVLSELTAWKVAVVTYLAEMAPRLAAAVCVMLLAWGLAVLTRWIARRVAKILWLDGLLLQSAVVSGLIEPTGIRTPRLISELLYWALLAAGAGAAVSILDDRATHYIASLVLVYFPRFGLMAAILVATWWAARYCGRSALIWMTNEEVARPWRWSAFVRLGVRLTGIALASEVTGFATTLVRSAFLVVLTGFTILMILAVLPAVRAQVEILLSPARDANPETSDDRLWR